MPLIIYLDFGRLDDKNDLYLFGIIKSDPASEQGSICLLALVMSLDTYLTLS